MKELKIFKMLTNKEEVIKYLQSNNLEPAGDYSVEFMNVGNINYVFEIKSGEETKYLKFFGPLPRRNTETIQLIGYTPRRFDKEIGALSYLRNTLNGKFLEAIPSLSHLDKNTRVIIVTDIAQGGPVLKELLLSNFNLAKVKDVFTQVAHFIGEQHIRTLGQQSFDPYFTEDEEFNRRFYDFRTLVSCRKLTYEKREYVKKVSETIYKENKRFPTLISNDLSPKQIFIRPDNSIGLCDFEIMAKGVASYDIGFFIANVYIIKTIREDYQEELSSLVNHFKKEYFSYLEKNCNNPEFISFTNKHINFFIGTGILNRIDAVPLEPHISESKTKKLREIGQNFIFSNKII